ncbi:uncharacterized protein EI90DRAFT_2646168 [Cantharellus anzutake]|uniref:uncharacterized protein n=1 Tax=Cantharellus anzutake TaxID=1750568 RepID=UPI001904866A|nr:uncharacterized protein EI90DRAFT_2646168 [Cantharellus anzutake]KAF8337387.1 hypothetical protein EI90DRAFT_2646168 [Cantharellus anzutake]
MDDGRPFAVKFVHRYCEDAHRLLAQIGRAPTLHHCGSIGAGIIIVAMDFLNECQDSHSRYPSGLLPARLLQDVKEAVELIHKNKIVHGDLRQPNIMIWSHKEDTTDEARREEHAMLVDFDWCGRVVKRATRLPYMILGILRGIQM